MSESEHTITITVKLRVEIEAIPVAAQPGQGIITAPEPASRRARAEIDVIPEPAPAAPAQAAPVIGAADASGAISSKTLSLISRMSRGIGLNVPDDIEDWTDGEGQQYLAALGTGDEEKIRVPKSVLRRRQSAERTLDGGTMADA